MKEINELISQYLSQGIFSGRISNKLVDFMSLYLTMVIILISFFFLEMSYKKIPMNYYIRNPLNRVTIFCQRYLGKFPQLF